jgi:hypothetical protein
VLLDLTMGDFLDISITLGRVFKVGNFHTKGDLATHSSSLFSVLSPCSSKKACVVECSKFYREIRTYAYLSSATLACVLIRQSASVDLHMLKC